MKTTSLSEFQNELRSTGAYATAPSHRAKKRARPSALATLRYSWGVTRVFPFCAITEPFGILTTQNWAKACLGVVNVAEKLG